MVKEIRSGDETAIEAHADWVATIPRDQFKRILDVGGAARPLRAATHVIDLEPAPCGPPRGRISDTRYLSAEWLQRDICDVPWPYPDKFFDYVWCSQVLEDIRDPIAVCKEMIRVSLRGFCSTVHRSYESCALQADGVTGYHHHRWLIELWEKENRVTFTFKTPILQVMPEYRPPGARQWLLHWIWDDTFEPVEVHNTSHLAQYDELRDYLKRW